MFFFFTLFSFTKRTETRDTNTLQERIINCNNIKNAKLMGECLRKKGLFNEACTIFLKNTESLSILYSK